MIHDVDLIVKNDAFIGFFNASQLFRGSLGCITILCFCPLNSLGLVAWKISENHKKKLLFAGLTY